GTVHIYLKAVVALYKALFLYLADEIEHLLRPADGKGRDDNVPAPVERALDHLRERADVVGPALAVGPVSVGGLDDEVIRLADRLRVTQDGLIGVADVAGEHQLFRDPVLREPELDAGRTQKVADVREAQDHALRNVDGLAVGAGAQALHQG